MGASRVNGALLDLKFHNASTSLQVTQDDGKFFYAFSFKFCISCLMSVRCIVKGHLQNFIAVVIEHFWSVKWNLNP